jgi:hypothetical protein
MAVRMIGRLARLAMLPADCRRRGGRRPLARRDGTIRVDARGLPVRRQHRCCRVRAQGDGTLMGKRRNQYPQQLQDTIFAGNPFLDDLLAWRHSPEGEQFAEFSDALCEVMADVQLDARHRRLIWPDGERLDLAQSVARIHRQNPDLRRDWIEEYLIDWIEMDYAPEHYSKAQLDELDRLTARWIADHFRRGRTTKKQSRTRHS